MNKSLILSAALLTALATPSFAADQTSGHDIVSAQLTANANAQQVRNLLRAKDYTNISELRRDENGRWTGTAVKDGKTTVVSVQLPGKPAKPQTN